MQLSKRGYASFLTDMFLVDAVATRAWVLGVLRECHGSLKLSARQLDVSGKLLMRMVRKHGLGVEVEEMRRAWRDRWRVPSGMTTGCRRDGAASVP